jgi:hypothetical protein
VAGEGLLGAVCVVATVRVVTCTPQPASATAHTASVHVKNASRERDAPLTTPPVLASGS